jgi:hypothetical protein
MPKPVTSFPHGTCRKKNGRCADSAEGGVIQKKKRQNDRWIKPYASHSSFVKFGQAQSVSTTESAIRIIPDSVPDGKSGRKVKCGALRIKNRSMNLREVPEFDYRISMETLRAP